jgi:eukaryotic-like serine/threonine-protein kinase
MNLSMSKSTVKWSDLPEDNLDRIDRKADEFEESWRRGERPRVEEYLGDATGKYRTALLEELLTIEWQRRRKLGEQPDPGEYVERFPEHDRWIRQAIRSSGSDPEAAVDPGHAVTPTPDGFPDLVDYELIEWLGAGGMGVVYLARKRSRLDGGLVALKMIAEHAVSRESIDHFLTEMKNQARLQHPHIVQVLDSGHQNGRPYFTMTYCRGSDLARVLKEHGPLDPTTAALYVSRVAWAVQYLHAQSDPLVHGDLKPKNILLDHHGDGNFPFGRPHLADFGLVALLQKVSAGISRGSLIGTVPYMAPEQVEGRAGVGPASDVWGLGVILFECLTGNPPFRGETRAEILYQIVHRETPSPRAIRPDVPRDLQLICLKCLKKSPESRYRSASELVEDLERFLQRRPLAHARPEALWDRVVQWTRRAPALAARLAVIVACSAILWGYPLVTGGKFAPLAPDHPVVTKILPRLGLDRSSPSVLQAAAAVLVWANQVTLIAWGLVSWAFQRRLDRSRLDGGLQLGWRVADVATMVLLIQFDDALMSPLTVAFAVLIVASAFWSRAGQIIHAILLSMTGYVVLVVIYLLSHPGTDRHYRHFHYLVGLALLGLMLSYQANRTQALARISGSGGRS